MISTIDSSIPTTLSLSKGCRFFCDAQRKGQCFDKLSIFGNG